VLVDWLFAWCFRGFGVSALKRRGQQHTGANQSALIGQGNRHFSPIRGALAQREAML
jgi:hypothetical protein